jgi:hypothetical protein
LTQFVGVKATHVIRSFISRRDQLYPPLTRKPSKKSKTVCLSNLLASAVCCFDVCDFGRSYSSDTHPLTTHFSLSGGVYMRIAEIRPDKATVALTLDEFRILNNAMNEIFSITEFETRVGGTLYSVEILIEAGSAGIKGLSSIGCD